MQRVLIGMVVASAVMQAGAALELDPLFTDQAVLQQGQPVAIWGRGDPGQALTVSFGAQRRETRVDAEGNWRVTLDPLSASPQANDLVVTDPTNTVTRTGLVVGEVWLASGQSNMEWPVERSHDADLERATARLPLVRELRVGHRSVSKRSSMAVIAAPWRPAAPETVGSFSAVAYAFAQDIHRATGHPVGILHCSWGGSNIETWMSPESLADPVFAPSHARWNQPRPEGARAPLEQHRPSGAYLGMLHPLANYALRGVLWYQGEANTPWPREYGRLFTTLITDWRKLFAGQNLPFYWVQLAGHRGDETNWPQLREAQSAAMALPATGQAVVLDLGESGDVHPRAKQAVGRRLARLVLHDVYGFKDVARDGPVISRAEVREGGFIVEIQPAGVALRRRHPQIRGFEIAGADRAFHPAGAVLQAGILRVTCEAVPEPVALRYGWRDYSEANLTDERGLPLAPFRTDDW
jgi:sialate O-acetylesterase